MIKKYIQYLRRRYRIKKVCKETIKNLRMVCSHVTKDRFNDHVKMMRAYQGYYNNNIHLIDVVPIKRGFKIKINLDKLNKESRWKN